MPGATPHVLRQSPPCEIMSFSVRFVRLFLTLGAVALISGCVSTEEATGPQPDTGRRELPWNTPQGWEQTGVLGGYADQIGTR